MERVEGNKREAIVFDIYGVAKWVQPCHLVKIYSLSRTTIYNHLNMMRTMPKYSNSFKNGGTRQPLIKLKDFDSFLDEAFPAIKTNLRR